MRPQSCWILPHRHHHARVLTDMSLFDATPVTDDDTDADEPTRLADPPENDAAGGAWQHDELPIEFVLGTPSRFELTVHAVRAVSTDAPLREHNKSELSDAAGVSRNAVHEHIDVLAELGVYNKLGGAISRYRPNENSVILKALIGVNEQIRDRAARL